MAMYGESEETTQDNILGVYKKVGFVYPGKDSYKPDLGFCIKDQRLTISGKISLTLTKKKVILTFQKKKRYKKVYGLDESSDIEIFEDRNIFGYQYEVHIPQENLTSVK